jgi:hypothetical protein
VTYFHYNLQNQSYTTEEQLGAKTIGRNKDVWSMSFSLMSSKLIAWLSQKYNVVSLDTNAEREKWVKEELTVLEEMKPELESKRMSLFAAMGLN